MIGIGFWPLAQPIARAASGRPDGRGDLAVARRLAVGDLAQGRPDRELERRPGRIKGQLEVHPGAGKVLGKLPSLLVEVGISAPPGSSAAIPHAGRSAGTSR